MAREQPRLKSPEEPLGDSYQDHRNKLAYVSFDLLKGAINKVWSEILHDEVINLVAGMGMRCLDAAERSYKHLER